MATKKKTPPVVEEYDEELDYKPSEAHYDMKTYQCPINQYTAKRGDVFVAINGRSMQIKRGSTVDVPENFYNVLKQSEQAQEEHLRKVMNLSTSFKS